ncbi:MAG: hypothetical protein RIS73_666 [Bacteroidota bacterium]|jgi:gliding motility-associated-like protein
MRKLLSLILLFFCITKTVSQSCFNIAAGNDTTISCVQSCLDLKVKIPDVRTTDDYQVVAIPYQPFPFINAGGVIFNPTYIDDSYSSEITLPFTFCFYGINYTKCVVGTNGILTFELSNANTFNSWLLNLGDVTTPGAIQPIPYQAGGTPNNPDLAYYPRAAIMGPYHDIDPEVTQPQPTNRRMEYIITGTSPCRKFILNYNEIPYFNCPTTIVTQQMVLYEGTGIIDIFIKSKPTTCLPTTNEGRAILGIQNWDRDKAVVVNGRNNTIWSARNEGWRFVPSGNTSLFNRVELYKKGALISTGSTTTTGNGELQAAFTNICQAEDSMSYEIKAFYQKCDNPAIETEGSDTIIVYKTLNTITANSTPILCNGTGSTITIIAPVAAGIEYSINSGATWQTSNSFNVAAGNYTILARNTASTCLTSANIIIPEPLQLNVAATTTNATCTGNDGKIILAANGGTKPYQYSIDNGITYQASNIFIVQPGNYNKIIIKDANNCIANTAAVIVLNDQMFLNTGTDTTICANQSFMLLPKTNAETSIFIWSPANGLSSSTIKNPVAAPADTILFTLVAKWGVCQRTDDILINVLRKPVVNTGNDTIICNNTIAFLNASISNLSGSVNYAWAPATNIVPPNALNAVVKPTSTQLYTLTVKDNYGCNFVVTDNITVTVRPPVVAFAGNDTIAVYGMPHQLFGSGGNNYLWSPAAKLNSPFIQNPLATLYNDAHFTVAVSNDIGCSNTDEVFIKVYRGPAYYIPNAFTPNADGLNDIFKPVAVGISITHYFRVFNRYGEIIFETTQLQKGWDGTYKGKNADAGNYIWMISGIDKDGKAMEIKGSVLLVK